MEETDPPDIACDILADQASKLFDVCDEARRGFVVEFDLGVLSAYLNEELCLLLAARCGQEDGRFLTRAQFVDIIVTYLTPRSPKRVSAPVDESVSSLTEEGMAVAAQFSSQQRPSLLRMSEVTLADELAVSTMTVPARREPFQMNLEEEDPSPEATAASAMSTSTAAAPAPYPFRVENHQSPLAELNSPTVYDSTTLIKRRQFRPLLPDFEPAMAASSVRGMVAPQQSLADELNAAQNGIPRGAGGIPPELDMRTPDRIFKVVFVGDSAVGKTCFLHRFCHNRFRPLFNATIGVDFTVKTVQLRDRLLAVQLWDTAGQERFRSITKQYFRKADGVVLMYDVTSEQSFLNVRNWIESVQQGVDESTVMCLVGNKVDLFANDQSRSLTYKMGKQIANEFKMLFFETSAFTGFGINECMLAMAERLQRREEQHLEEALKLEMLVENKRSWCC